MDVLILPRVQLYRRAAELFAEAANRAVRARGRFTVALSGGKTPVPLYRLLAEEFADAIPWDRTEVFFGDECCVPPSHPDSNFGMVYESLLRVVNVPPPNVHRMRGEIDPETAAREYALEIRQVFALEPDQVPQFDLILLGMGEDGHTASLFPGSQIAAAASGIAAAPYVPKLGAHRLTLTPPVIARARMLMLLVTGREKADALKRVLEDQYDPARCPAQLARTAEGKVVFLVDEDAAAHLSPAQPGYTT